MTTRNLDALFGPKAIALIGASNEAGSVGHVLARNALGAGFSGPIMPVNPHASAICGTPSYQAIASLPHLPELAVIATPARATAQVVRELAAAGCRCAVIITAGLTGADRRAVEEAARPTLMRVLGPNCLGFLSPVSGINASFAHRMPARGRLAFVTQSGAIATSMIDWAIGRGVGFSHLLSLGDMADIDFGDLLDYLALDEETDAILLYAETITQARKFMSAGRIASRNKPVIVVKGGRSGGGARAAASHTGALAGSDIVYDAAFRRAGMLRVSTLRELFDAAETLASGIRLGGDRLAILTNGGGLGVLAADALETGGGALAQLSEETTACLSACLPPAWSKGNPIDVLGDAGGGRYADALACLSTDRNHDAILVMNCPTGLADPVEAATAVVEAKSRGGHSAMLACWAGLATTGEARALLQASGVPTFDTPDEAARAFLHLSEFALSQRALYEAPASASGLPPDTAEGRRIIDRAVAEGRKSLAEEDIRGLLQAYQIPVVETVAAASPLEAGLAAERLGGPVVLKIRSADISHKSDVGGVQINLSGAQKVRAAAEDMLERVKSARPGARIDGFIVQRMIMRSKAQELLLGAAIDPTFGPCLMFGQGGVAAEVVSDRCMGLPPLSLNLARDMIARTRVARLLAGFRDRPRADLDGIAKTLIALSEMVIALPEISELDINPLLADGDGVVALDARVILSLPGAPGPLPAILPYPAHLTRTVLASGAEMTLRPIRPDDADGLVEMAQRTDPRDLWLRFHGAVGTISRDRAARLSQIDYDREMVLVSEASDGALTGVVRLVFEPDFEHAEAAIIVRSDCQHRGLGTLLLDALLDYARARGAKSVWGIVMRQNDSVLNLVRRRGASIAQDPADPSMARIEIPLP